jgi:predicted O-methyltransferase YrrM
MDFIPSKIQEYAEKHTTSESEVLSELAYDTRENVPGAQMLSGHLQGQFLSMISKLVKPSSALDVGTYTGYSAISLAAGITKGGTVHTIDKGDSLQKMVAKYITRAALDNIVQRHTGDALEIIPALNTTFQLSFIDADKKNYPEYYSLLIDKTDSGGVILIDNTLWSGKVTESDKDEKTKAIDQVNKQVQQDNQVDNVLLPIRDGLMFIRKK